MTLERRLSSVLSEFAHTLVTDFPIQAILDHLVCRIVDVLPIDSAGVTLIEPGEAPRYVAASDEAALRFERLQTGLGEGPCVDAVRSGIPVAVADLSTEHRFPNFSARAGEAGLAAVFTFPLRHEEVRLGALDLYSMTIGGMDEEAMAAAQTLADVATAYILNARARADLQTTSKLARHTSLHDPLTGLPNRALLIERLDRSQLRCLRSDTVGAILYVDLDKFKVVNDTYGHHVGDELLVAVAHRLTSLLRPGDTVARFGGDEFIVLCDDLGETSRIGPLASRIEAALTSAFTLSVGEVVVSASIGIAFIGPDINAESVLQLADTAMYEAKQRVSDRAQTGDRWSMNTQKRPTSSIVAPLVGAAGDGLLTGYQPIVSLDRGQVCGMEAIVISLAPVLDRSPDVAIRATSALRQARSAESVCAVLERACTDRQAWVARCPSVVVFVNVSAHQLLADGFAAAVANVLVHTGTDPGDVVLELTEMAFIGDRAKALRVTNDLRSLGVTLALDDFGTGPASLSDLKHYPVGLVKVGREFIDDLEQDESSRLIVQAIIRLAHGCGMTVVAQGLETAAQCALVRAMGCDLGQGTHLGPTGTADEVSLFVRDGSAGRSA